MVHTFLIYEASSHTSGITWGPGLYAFSEETGTTERATQPSRFHENVNLLGQERTAKDFFFYYDMLNDLRVESKDVVMIRDQ